MQPKPRERRIFWLCPGRDAGDDCCLGARPIELSANSPRRFAGASRHRCARALPAARRARLPSPPRLLERGCDRSQGGALRRRDLVGRRRSTRSPSRCCAAWSTTSTRRRASPACRSRPPTTPMGVLQACGWMTGFPMRTGFAPRVCRARSLAVRRPSVWSTAAKPTAAFGYPPIAPRRRGWHDAPPDDRADRSRRGFRTPPQVPIAVGRPGIDHAAVRSSGRRPALWRRSRRRSRATRSRSPTRLPGIAAALAESGARHADAHRRRARHRPGQRPRRRRRCLDARRPHRRAAATGRAPMRRYDAAGKIVMAGAIDIHSHIAGSNVNTARLLLPEHHRGRCAARPRRRCANAGWSTFETGCLYAAMGFTTVVEPAVSPHHALHAHLELADIPIIDKATLCGARQRRLSCSACCATRKARPPSRDYVAWTLARDARARHQGHQCRRRGGVQGECARVSRSTTSCRATAFRRAHIVKTLQRAVDGSRRAASAACALQQPRPCRQRRDRARDDRRRRGPAAASRASAVLRLRQGRPARLLFGRARASPKRSTPRQNVTDRRRPGDVRPDGDDLVGRAAPVQRAQSGAQPEQMGDPRRRRQRRRHRALRLPGKTTSTTPCSGRPGSNCSC